MKKEYTQPEEKSNNNLEESTTSYSLPKQTIHVSSIPQKQLLQEIAEAEKDIQEGNIYTLEEVKKIILR